MVVLPPEVIPLQPINPNGGFPPEFGKIDAPAIAGSGTAAASSLLHWRGGLAFPLAWRPWRNRKPPYLPKILK
jgi:hypothetical protein